MLSGPHLLPKCPRCLRPCCFPSLPRPPTGEPVFLDLKGDVCLCADTRGGVNLRGCWLCLKCPPLSDHSPSQHKYFTYPSPKLQITLLLIRRNCSLPWGPTGLCSKLGMAHIMLHYQHFLGTYLALKTRGWFIFGSPGPSTELGTEEASGKLLLLIYKNNPVPKRTPALDSCLPLK